MQPGLLHGRKVAGLGGWGWLIEGCAAVALMESEVPVRPRGLVRDGVVAAALLVQAARAR